MASSSFSRREQNMSTSSARSERSDRTISTRSSPAADIPKPAIESTVTHLLVSIKQLLEALTSWSQLKIDENAVSDVYVKLGNDFNAAVTAFGTFGIDMSELLSVPNDLRNVLEQCLAEDATDENLELYLPTVRQIITHLLQGLRGKQSIYRRMVSDKSKDKVERGDRNSRSGRGHRSQTSRSGMDGGPDGGSMNRRREKSSSRRITSSSQSAIPSMPNGHSNASAEDDASNTFVGGFAFMEAEQGSSQRPSPLQEVPPRHDSIPRDAARSPPPPTPPAVPASVKRYSLVDKPMLPSSSPPAVTITLDPEEPNATESYRVSLASVPPPPPIPASPPGEAQLTFESSISPPLMANSLAALKSRDTLERRASKRFSTYNISKMTSPSGAKDKERSAVSLRDRVNRRSLAAGPVLTAGELAVLTEEDEANDDSNSLDLNRHGSGRAPGASIRPSVKRSTSKSKLSVSTIGEETTVPSLPGTKPSFAAPQGEATISSQPSISPVFTPSLTQEPELPRTPGRFKVFLQLGREVKKVEIEPGLSFPALRVLFVDKFSYNPGLENFPSIYIRDPSSGVQYELEDIDEVKPACLLSLNIEPLDQIKQHIDSHISALSQDIKELKSAVATNSNRLSSHFTPSSPIVGQPLAESTPAAPRPTDRQFHNVARRLSRFIGSAGMNSMSSNISDIPPLPFTIQQQIQPQMTGASTTSEYSSRVVNDLKTQFDEVQNLRRDLGIMKQLYSEFMKSTKESLSTLRSQTQSVKALANTKIGGSRAYIESGQKKLDERSQNVLTEIEKIQDLVESVRDDVLKRHITPKPQSFKNLKKDIDKVGSELESLKEYINTVKPMWKKTWQEELQTLIDQQQFLDHQEKFLTDLLVDYKDAQDVYGNVEQVISLKASSKVYKPGFRPPPPEEGHEGLSTVLKEIRGAQFDPEKRMKAIEANQRSRLKELEESQGDELQSELKEFVVGKKLRLTGGAEETDRVRQIKNDKTLKAMFTGQSLLEGDS